MVLEDDIIVSMSNDENELHLYTEMFTRLTHVADGLTDPAADLGEDLFDQCCILCNSIINQETDPLYLESWKQVARTLKWHIKTWIQMKQKPFDNLDVMPHDKIMTNEMDLVPSSPGSNNMSFIDTTTCDMNENLNRKEDSKAVSLGLAIAATRLDPGPGGLDAVAGLTVAKQLLKEAAILPMRFPHLFTGGRRTWNRVLLYGPPGTGKTRLAQAIASEVGAIFYSVSSADILSSWVGESEKLIRELFQYPRRQDEPSIIFIDEIDGLCRRRTTSEEEHTRRMKTALLAQFEGTPAFLRPDPVFLLCATNCPWELDPAFLRRFQRHIYIPLPDRPARHTILSLHAQGTNIHLSHEDWQQLLDLTEGYSGSDLANLTLAALLEPLRDMETCGSWVYTAGGNLMPCADNTPGAIKCILQDLPPDKVEARDVLLRDYLKALDSTPRTVTKADIDMFGKFSKTFGHMA